MYFQALHTAVIIHPCVPRSAAHNSRLHEWSMCNMAATQAAMRAAEELGDNYLAPIMCHYRHKCCPCIPTAGYIQFKLNTSRVPRNNAFSSSRQLDQSVLLLLLSGWTRHIEFNQSCHWAVSVSIDFRLWRFLRLSATVMSTAPQA